jgi:hypothetical protein
VSVSERFLAFLCCCLLGVGGKFSTGRAALTTGDFNYKELDYYDI